MWKIFKRERGKKYTKPKYSFTHTNKCNKNVSDKKTECYFIFKNNSNIKKNNNSKKHLVDYLKNENLNDNDYNYCKYCLEITEKYFDKLNKYDLIEKFKICSICNKIDNDILKTCKFCENKIHKKCMTKERGCTCKKEDKFFDSKINNFSIICKIINEKYFKKNKKKLNLKLPPNSEEFNITDLLKKEKDKKNKKKLNLKLPVGSENFNVVDLLKTEKKLEFNDDLYYERDNKLSNLIEYGNVELEDNDKNIYYKLKKQTIKGNYNYIRIEKHPTRIL